LSWAAVVAGAALVPQPGLAGRQPLPISLVCLDAEATGYGTFQSHNQKVVSNRRGIFLTHIRSRNEAYTAQCWRLSWSTNHGESFITLFTATNATSAPVLETDAADNLYLMRPDFLDGHAHLYRFLACEDYREPHRSRIPNGSAGKYAMILDARRAQLAYFAHNNTFHQVGLDGALRSSTRLLAAGPNALLQYPLLSLGEDGTLHAAWTTQKTGNVYLYWDIHYLQSPDGGHAWRGLNGAPVRLPVVADDTGPADRITLDDEFECHTWLSSFLVHGDKAHFLYLAQCQPPRQHYVRYDLRTARRERDQQPDFRGQQLSLRGLDGFFAVQRGQTGATLYCVGRDAHQPRLVCLASRDNGTTWQDYAVSQPVHSPYAIGGCRAVTADGWIIGAFTDIPSAPAGGGPAPARVYFFKIKADQPAPRHPGAT